MVWVERTLERTHRFDFFCTLVAQEFVAFHDADPVFCTDRTAEFADDDVHDAIDFLPTHEEYLVIAALGHAEIEMDVSISQMPEWHGTDTGNALTDSCNATCEEFGNRCDGDRNI